MTTRITKWISSKTFFATLAIFSLSFGTVNAQTWNIGTPNATDITATLSEGTLTISGNGAMQDFGINDNAPWFSIVGSSIKSLVIQPGVTNIGRSAFAFCTSLTSLTIPNSVTSIGDRAFYGCFSLTGNLIIPNSVISIGEYAFISCSGFTGDLSIPNSVTSIGYGAFVDCYGLTSVTISNSVTSIGYGAFGTCIGLTAINVDAGNLNYSSDNGVLFNKNKTTLIQYPGGKSGVYVIPNTVISIDDFAFYSCINLTSVTIPNSVTSIGNYAFSGCIGFTGNLSIPNSVTSIGNYVFAYCNSLTSIIIPNSVTSIGNYAFAFCDSLTTINVDDGNQNYSSDNGVLFNKNKTILIQYPTSKSGVYVIPNTVTSIGDSTFYRCSGLTSVTIPNSVTSIGKFAFYLCTSITSVTIPNSVTSIGNSAFGGCHGLTSVIIPNSVTLIGDNAFRSCWGLTGILTIPNSVTSIGNYSFYGCSGFTGNLSIPNSVTSIGDYAFASCSDLTSVIIPNSITSIGDYAFELCQGLTSVTCLNPNPSLITLGINVFNVVDKFNCILKVPAGSVTAYQNVAQWEDFINIVEESATALESITNDLLRIYPNPVKDELRIESDVPFYKLLFTIYNLAGKQTVNGQLLNGKSINVSSLPQGVYFVKIKIGKSVLTKKFVKE